MLPFILVEYCQIMSVVKSPRMKSLRVIFLIGKGDEVGGVSDEEEGGEDEKAEGAIGNH